MTGTTERGTDHAIDWPEAERAAQAFGREYGTAAGSWVTSDFGRNPGSDAALAQQAANALTDEGIGSFVGPLFAYAYADDCTVGDFYAAVNVDAEDDEDGTLLTIAEDAYYAAAEVEAWRSLRHYLTDDEQ